MQIFVAFSEKLNFANMCQNNIAVPSVDLMSYESRNREGRYKLICVTFNRGNLVLGGPLLLLNIFFLKMAIYMDLFSGKMHFPCSSCTPFSTIFRVEGIFK